MAVCNFPSSSSSQLLRLQPKTSSSRNPLMVSSPFAVRRLREFSICWRRREVGRAVALSLTPYFSATKDQIRWVHRRQTPFRKEHSHLGWNINLLSSIYPWFHLQIYISWICLCSMLFIRRFRIWGLRIWKQTYKVYVIKNPNLICISTSWWTEGIASPNSHTDSSVEN